MTGRTACCKMSAISSKVPIFATELFVGALPTPDPDDGHAVESTARHSSTSAGISFEVPRSSVIPKSTSSSARRCEEGECIGAYALPSSSDLFGPVESIG